MRLDQSPFLPTLIVLNQTPLPMPTWVSIDVSDSIPAKDGATEEDFGVREVSPYALHKNGIRKIGLTLTGKRLKVKILQNPWAYTT